MRKQNVFLVKVSVLIMVMVLCFIGGKYSAETTEAELLQAKIDTLSKALKPSREKILENYKERAGALRDIRAEKEKRELIEGRSLTAFDTTDYTSFLLSLDKIIIEHKKLYGYRMTQTFVYAMAYYKCTSGGKKTLTYELLVRTPHVTDEEKYMEYFKGFHGLTMKDIYKVFNKRTEEEKIILNEEEALKDARIFE